MSSRFISTAWKGRKFTQGTMQFATTNLTTSSLMGKKNIISELVNIIDRSSLHLLIPFDMITIIV